LAGTESTGFGNLMTIMVSQRNSLFTLLMLASLLAAGSASPKVLRIFAIDVEGGQATLIVAPSGDSLLVDAGWAGFNGRDADRIVSAAKIAGVSKIDYLITTHYHTDHVGGVPQLAARIPIGTFVDHGPNIQDSPDASGAYDAYLAAVGKSQRKIVKPGDRFELGEADVQVLSAGGEVITKPVAGGGEKNSNCGVDPRPEEDFRENAQSVGILITFGRFRFLDLGDLTRKRELKLACPLNLVGNVDLFLVSHHGYSESNSKALVWGVQPRAAILNAGSHKGGIPLAWQIVHGSPRMSDIWQLHYPVDAGPNNNSPEPLIANPEGQVDSGHYISVSALEDATFTVVNSRNKFSKTYTNKH
jgi:competence protein ComEC